jgi:predicted  nucleic acid-binding Zn-ribbon protein
MAKTAKTPKQAGAEKPHDLKKYLEDIKQISDWFEEQEEIDLEEALVKIREAGELIKLSKDRLVEVENEFREIKAKIEEE